MDKRGKERETGRLPILHVAVILANEAPTSFRSHLLTAKLKKEDAAKT